MVRLLARRALHLLIVVKKMTSDVKTGPLTLADVRWR
jgi:hypothetical protein